LPLVPVSMQGAPAQPVQALFVPHRSADDEGT